MVTSAGYLKFAFLISLADIHVHHAFQPAASQ
jgi:hypothetical protein